MKKLFYITLIFLFAGTITSCDKEYSEFYSDNRPDIPVTYLEATTHGFNPYIEVPLTANNIKFTLSIPESSGRKITEISKVLAGGTGINAGGVRAGTYIAAPIAGNGTNAVFTTTISAFRSKSAANEKLVADFISSTTAVRLQIAFMFLVKLDNNQEIIPVQAQVWITK